MNITANGDGAANGLNVFLFLENFADLAIAIKWEHEGAFGAKVGLLSGDYHTRVHNWITSASDRGLHSMSCAIQRSTSP